MFGVTVFAIVLTVVLADGGQKCGRLFRSGAGYCCKDDVMPPPPADMTVNEFKECSNVPRGPPSSCEREICIAKKQGIASDDGKIDMDAYEKKVTEDLKANPVLVEAIKENCIKGDISKYGPSDACQLRKLMFCTHRTKILGCKEWSDDGPCAGMKDLVKECSKLDE